MFGHATLKTQENVWDGPRSGKRREGGSRLASPPRRVPDEQAATPEEVRVTLAELSAATWIKLKKYAGWRIRGVPEPQRERRDGIELLRWAMELTLEGQRRWHKRQDLVEHLKDVMSSEANHWSKRPVPDQSILACDLTRITEDGTETNPLLQAPTTEPSPEREAIAKNLLGQIEALFVDDSEASVVLGGLLEGLSVKEIAAALDLGERTVEANVKKIRRRARTAFPEGKDL